jgi:hypothetical protein
MNMLWDEAVRIVHYESQKIHGIFHEFLEVLHLVQLQLLLHDSFQRHLELILDDLSVNLPACVE